MRRPSGSSKSVDWFRIPHNPEFQFEQLRNTSLLETWFDEAKRVRERETQLLDPSH